MTGKRQVLAGLVLLTGCGAPHLVALSGNPLDGDVAVAKAHGLTLVAARNEWYEDRLAQVSTPIHITVVNAGDAIVPVGPEELSLIDEQGRVYHPLPLPEVALRLFGSPELPPLPEQGEPPQPPPNDDLGPQAPQPPNPPEPPQPPAPPQPPGGQATAPLNGNGSQISSPATPLEITLVGHGGGHGGGGKSAGGGAHFSGGAQGGYPTTVPYSRRRGYGYGRYGYGWGRPWGAYGGRYGAWGGYGAYPWIGAWGWWFAPAYVVGLSSDYYDYGDLPDYQAFGPEQLETLALRPTDLEPQQRMGGLVFFEPAWNARLVTLKLNAQPEGTRPLKLTVRFAVSR